MIPKYCPNCGKKINSKSCQAFEVNKPNAAYATSMGMVQRDVAWDCYCKYCHWSGDISPDFRTNTELKRAIKEFEKK